MITRLVIISVCMIWSFCSTAQTYSRVTMNNGQMHVGRVIHIGENYVLLDKNGGNVTLLRDSIRYHESYQVGFRNRHSNKPKITLKPIDKRFLNEVETGLTFALPFALRIGYTKWFSASHHWHFGLGATWQFYRYSMFNVNVSARAYLGNGRFIKPFFESSFGLSFYEYVNGLNFRNDWGFIDVPPNYKSEFNSVKQATIGPGLYMDTGLGVALTTRFLYNLTWYEETRYPTPTYYVKGQYLFSSASILFGFVF